MWLALAVASSLVQAKPVADLEARRGALRELLAEQWEHTLRRNPEFASVIGDKRWNDRLTDFSQQAIDADLAETKAFLARFEAIDATGFPEQEVLNRTLMIRGLRETVEAVPFKEWEMPVNQMSGLHLDAPQLVSLLSFESVKDYDDWTARLRRLPTAFAQIEAQMRNGIAAGLMPPRFLLEKVAAQAEDIAAQKPEDTPFARALAEFPAGVPAADRTRVRAETIEAIRDGVLPAYERFARFVRQEYAPHGRSDPGIWSLPEGGARYASLAKRSTTTTLTPDEIHAIGRQEVARIEGEMHAVAARLGYSDLKALNAAIERNPALHAHSREQILAAYRHYIDQMWAKLPELFGRLPKAKLEVLPTEEFREKEAPSAEYNQGTPDGSRPGHVMVNTGDATQRKTLSFESTAYHEGVPGHHLQIAIAQELPTLPPFRQQGGYTAYVEGWALYAERLGKEVGFYQDPYNDYGRLQDEMLRAIRLVVDTGLHAKKWTREQVVQYFHDHSATDEVEVQSETDRYIAWPGQALGYKIGQLKILELRDRARKALGPKFDLRAFHDEILGAGALPLDVLEQRVDVWIAERARP